VGVGGFEGLGGADEGNRWDGMREWGGRWDEG